MSSDSLEAGITCIGVGVGFLIIGIWMLRSGNPSLIHSYHIAQVPRSRHPFVARLTGFGAAVAGLGITLIGACFLVAGGTSSIAMLVAIALALAGIGVAFATIVAFTFWPWL